MDGARCGDRGGGEGRYLGGEGCDVDGEGWSDRGGRMGVKATMYMVRDVVVRDVMWMMRDVVVAC